MGAGKSRSAEQESGHVHTRNAPAPSLPSVSVPPFRPTGSFALLTQLGMDGRLKREEGEAKWRRAPLHPSLTPSRTALVCNALPFSRFALLSFLFLSPHSAESAELRMHGTTKAKTTGTEKRRNERRAAGAAAAADAAEGSGSLPLSSFPLPSHTLSVLHARRRHKCTIKR